MYVWNLLAEVEPEYNLYICCFQLTERINGMKIGFLKEGFEKCKENVSDVIKGILPHLEAIGATVEWVSIPEHFDGSISISTRHYFRCRQTDRHNKTFSHTCLVISENIFYNTMSHGYKILLCIYGCSIKANYN